MPAILTHYTFAKTIYPEEYNNSSLVYLGAQGPDVFFFYGYTKKRDDKKKIRAVGHYLHNIDIADVYSAMFEYIAKVTRDDDKEKLYAYLRGMMYHYILDRNAHPFIFYRTGAIESVERRKPTYYTHAHVFYESNLDTLMCESYQTPRKNIKAIKTDTSDILKISIMYKYVIDKLFKFEYFSGDTFFLSYMDMKSLQKMFYSRTGLKRMIYYPFRKKVQLWVQTNPRKAYHDDKIDYLNSNKSAWKIPDTGEERNDSFFEIFDRSAEECKVIESLIELGKTNDISKELHDFTKSINHDGCIIGNKKEHFDFCYKALKKVPF